MERERKRKRAKEWEKTRGDWGRGRGNAWERRCRRSKVGGMGFLKLISQAFPRPLTQSLLVFFPALSLDLFFARAPLSERLEQAICGLSLLFTDSFIVFMLREFSPGFFGFPLLTKTNISKLQISLRKVCEEPLYVN